MLRNKDAQSLKDKIRTSYYVHESIMTQEPAPENYGSVTKKEIVAVWMSLGS